ncbi:MAG: polysaccharide deacetylase family protein [Cyanobacteria bacterium P01_F01_bin.56]
MLIVKTSKQYILEKCYIFDIVLGRFLGLDFSVEQDYDINHNTLTDSNTGQRLELRNHLFGTPEKEWLTFSALPKSELRLWKLPDKLLKVNALAELSIPVIYGDSPENSQFYTCSDSLVKLGLDVFGSIFFMLTRYEEYVKPDRDQFGRFPATASLAYQEDFLHRPIVNEYVDILWACVKKLWPGLERQPRKFQMHVSHDVDSPYQYTFTNFSLLARNLAGDLIKRRNLEQGLFRMRTWNQVKQGNLAADPFNTFNWLMDLSEKHSLISAFYFITDTTDKKRDGNYSIHHPAIRQLIRHIHRRGHEIGLHPSFNTYLDAAQTQKEFDILHQVCMEEGVEQQSWGGRQHYLRWSNPHTWQNWEKAGLSYDSTLTFPEMPGFRCGTCDEFPAYDVVNRKPLNLIERPLVVMESTIFDERYLGLGHDLSQAFDRIVDLKQTCRKYRGNFTLLWHNNHLTTSDERDLYQQVMVY